MEKFETDGVVLKASVTGESDRIVHVLTRSRGVIRAFAKGARSTKSRLHAGAAEFVCGSFTFTEKGGVYHLNEAQVKETFYPLRLSLEKLTLAQYFCDLLLKIVPETESDPSFLRLFLNSLYFLCNEKKPLLQVKAVFELRAAVLSGYAPDLIGCSVCGAFETPVMFFDPLRGVLFCAACGNANLLAPTPLPVISAMRHIVFAAFDDVFRFELEPSLLPALSSLTERYAAVCFGFRSRLLDYFAAAAAAP